MAERKAEVLQATKWRTVQYSSVVGQLVVALDQHGAILAQVSISIPRPSLDYKAHAVPLAEQITVAMNNFDAYGLALLMIAEGVGDPTAVARRVLEKAGVVRRVTIKPEE